MIYRVHVNYCWVIINVAGKSVCLVGLHVGNYSIHKHLHSVNYSVVHFVLVQFVPELYLFYFISVAALLPKIVICELILLLSTSQEKQG